MSKLVFIINKSPLEKLHRVSNNIIDTNLDWDQRQKIKNIKRSTTTTKHLPAKQGEI